MAVKKWATTNGTVWSFNGSVVTSLVDSDNPQGIPPSTIRLKFSDPTYNPSTHTFYDFTSGNPANISWRQVSSEPNIWDGCYPPSRSGILLSWQALFKDTFNDHTNLVEVVGANFDGVMNLRELFEGCSSLISVATLDFGTAIDCERMFYACNNLRTVGDISIHGDDIYSGTSHIGFTSVDSMFRSCSSLTTVGNITVDHVDSLSMMFSGCSNLTSIGTIYAPEAMDINHAFASCNSLSNIPSITISPNADLFNMTFSSCYSLTTCPISSSLLNNATNCSYMFSSCTSLTTFPVFDMSHVVSMDSMFSGCTSLTGSIPAYDLRNVDSCNAAFNNCNNVSGGILDTYNRFMSYTIQPSSHTSCFRSCGSNTQTGSAELAQIPSSWK